MEISEFKIRFVVRHPVKTAQEIIAALPSAPRVVHSVGEPRKNLKGLPLGGVYDSTYVSFPLDTKGYSSIPAFLKDTLRGSFINAKMIEDVISTGGKASFYISIYCGENAGFSLPAPLLADLGSKGMTLDLDIYPEKYYSKSKTKTVPGKSKAKKKQPKKSKKRTKK